MGMFDWVNVEVPCPKCGEKLASFQTKDSACELGIVDPTRVSNFYSNCEHCGEWVEFRRKQTSYGKEYRTEPFSLEEILELEFVLVN